MNVVNWKPVAHFNDRSYGAGKPGLLISAKICCPCCRKEEDIRTDGQPFNKFEPNPLPLSWNIGTEIEHLEKRRECSFCGTVFSPVPKASRAAFVQEVFSKITQSWVDGEILLLKRSNQAIQLPI